MFTKSSPRKRRNITAHELLWRLVLAGAALVVHIDAALVLELPAECRPWPGRPVQDYYDATARFLYQGLPLEAELCIKEWKLLHPNDTRALYLQLTGVAPHSKYREKAGSYEFLAADVREAELLLDRLLDEIEDAEGSVSSDQAKMITPVYYALAYGHRELQDLDMAWAYLDAGNRLQWQSLQPSERFANELKIRLMDVWTSILKVPGVTEALSRTFAPFVPSRENRDFGKELVFIVGLPRTGSTLLERMLGRVPDMLATGEETLQKDGVLFQDVWIPVAEELAEHMKRGPLTLQIILGVFTPDRCQKFADIAVEHLRRGLHIVQEASSTGIRTFRFFTDKLLPNSIIVPFLRWLLPGSKILMCTRAPVEAAVSSYWKLFNGAYFLYTHDWDDLGMHFQSHRAMEESYLRSESIASNLLEVPYESLILNARETLRKVLEFLQIPWTDAVLDNSIASSQNEVRTASHSQVRMPIYQSGIWRWRRETEYFGPLLKYLSVRDNNTRPSAALAEEAQGSGHLSDEL